MTKLVVDASVAIKWFLPEPLSSEAWTTIKPVRLPCSHRILLVRRSAT